MLLIRYIVNAQKMMKWEKELNKYVNAGIMKKKIILVKSAAENIEK